jgi:glutamate-1-semialdehyde 2,1-aminomutase
MAYHRLDTTRSRELAERLRRVLPGGDTRSVTYYPPYPLALVRGEGCRVFDADGNSFVDLLNNYTALVHGHAHPKIVEALLEQAPLGTVFPAPNELQAEVAERICERFDSVDRVRFTNSGTEAVMQALRVARAVTGRDLLVKADGCYHGSWEQVPLSWGVRHARTATSGDTGGPDLRHAGVPSFVPHVVAMIPYNDVEALEALMAERGDEVAALIFEPVLGEGVITGNPEFFAAARRLADTHGALLVIDEVVTARLAWGGYQSIVGVKPDLTTFGKIIGGGLPVGAVGGREDVMAAFDPRRSGFVSHSGTFNGNPMTMAAGRVSLDLLTEDEIGRINRLGDALADGILRAFGEAELDGDVTSYGSFLHLHLESPAQISTFADVNLESEQLARLHLACLEEGVYFAPRGMLNTSTAMDESVIEEVVAGITYAAARVREEAVALTT